MKISSNFIDKATAAFSIFMFLTSATVTGQCPAAGDLRTNDCRATYSSLSDGNLTRTHNLFAGKLEPAFCIAHCGCLSKSYAALDSLGFCFCGNTQGTACSGQKDCSRVYSTSGIPNSPKATFPTMVELFSNASTTVTDLVNVVQFAVANEGKLSYFSPSTGSVAFVETGERKVSIEIEGYWGCRTPDYTVSVYSTIVMDLVCPQAVRPNEDFFCWVKIFEGSSIQSLEWKLDGSPLGAAINSVAAPLVLATGGNMTVDRFDKFNESCDFTRMEQSVFINPNYEFSATGQLKAFEAHITRKGEISLQIFRPICEQSQDEKVYCHSERKCVASGCGSPSTARGYVEFYPVSPKTVFCADVDRFKEDNNDTCPGPTAFSTVQADYELLFEYKVHVTQRGNTVIKVPADRNFTVQPGDVLGWGTACSAGAGDIGFYRYDDSYEPMYPEYQYKEVGQTVANSIFSRRLPTAGVFPYFHLLRAHTYNPTNYLKKLKFAILEQQYTVGVTLTAAKSVVTKTAQISVETDVTSFDFSADNVNVMVNKDVTFSVDSINTEVGVSYSLHFGETSFEGTYDRTVSKKQTVKQFAVAGIFNVICRAWNQLSHVERNVTVHVFGSIDKLEFTKEVDPRPTGDASISTFVTGGIGNVTVTYKLGDNSTERVLNLTLRENVYVEITNAYAVQGDYLIDVEVNHPLQTKTIKQYASVEDVINAVAITPPGVAATNQTHLLSLTIEIGTNVTHVWKWNDSTVDSTSGTNVLSMTHNYTTYGNRTITVYSFNKISNFTCSHFIEVQDKIQGLNFTQPVFSTYTISPTNQSQKTEAWFIMEQGTGVDIYVDWDSNKPDTRVSPKAYDRDKNNEWGWFIGHAEHQYASIETYNVTVHAKNAVSNMSVMTTAIYEVPLGSVTEKMEQKDLTTNYIEVNETVCYTLTAAAGTNLHMRCDFDDKYSEPFVTLKHSVCKNWTHWALPFNVSFTLFNNVSKQVFQMPTHVQMPVHNFTKLEISGGPENTTEPMELVLSDLTGDYFNCTCTIKDTKTVKMNILYTNFMTDGKIGKISVTHQFETPGVYDVEVECKNRLYEAKAYTNVTSCKAASDFKVNVLYGNQCGTKKVAGSKGDGDDFDLYAFGCELKIKLIDQTGSNITYEFDFGDDTPSMKTAASEVTHTFKQSSDSSRNMVITASNPTSNVVKVHTVKFLPRIRELKIGNSGPVKVGKVVEYNVTVQQKGLESCFLVECEAGKDPKTKEIFKTYFWMGADSCRAGRKYKIHKNRPDLDPINAKWQHTFKSTGKFRCTVTGENSVSLETASTDVIVLDKPCNKPKLEWNGIETTLKNPTNITRGKDKTVQTKVTKDCEKTDKVEYHWNVTLLKPEGGMEKIRSINHSKADSALKIAARTLDYGTYAIGVTVCMAVDSPVCSTIIGYIKVRPSLMVAQFKGGSGRAGGKDRILSISASPSYDPDVSLTLDKSIMIVWLCKRQSETFPDNIDDIPDVTYPAEGPAPAAVNMSINVTDSFKGCFGNGIGRLREFDGKSEITLNSSYMPLDQYFTIRLHLSKPSSPTPRENVTADYALYILLGDPPEIQINCVVNCGAKKNPDKPFKLQAVCTKHCGYEIDWMWTMRIKKADESDTELKAVEEFGSSWLKTRENQKNLAMKNNKMVHGNEYQVKLTGSLVRNSNVYGFSLFSIKINTRPIAPSPDKCRIIPEIGKPFQKIFKVVFGGFEDEDKPMKYFADYNIADGSSDGDWINFYSSLIPLSGLTMFPTGKVNGKVRIRLYCEDAFRAQSDFVYKEITVKKEDGVDLSKVLASSEGATDPAAAGQVADAVLAGLDESKGSDKGAVVGAIVDLMDSVEVNSPEGALTLSRTMSSCMDSGGMSLEKKQKAMKAMKKCANQMGPDTPIGIVNAVANSVISVLLKGTEEGGGDPTESDETTRNLGVVVAGNMVAGESPFVKSTGKSLVQCQAIDPGGDGAVALGSGGGFDMDSSQLGQSGVPLQAVGGNGPDKYSNSSSAKKDVTSDLVSLDMSSGGKPMEVQNLSKPIVVNIKQPVNPFSPTRHVSYTHILKEINVVDVPGDNESSIFIEINNATEMNDSCFYVIIKKGSKPKLYDNDFNFTLPHVVSRYKPDGSNKTSKEVEIEEKNRFRISLYGNEELNHTAIGTYYVAVLNSPCNTTNVSLPIMTNEYDPGPLNVTIQPKNFTFSSYTGICKFFNKTSKAWSINGLKILPQTNQNFTVCATSHLSSFAGGSVFAKPNTIDFSKAFAGFSNIGENPTVFATTLSIIGIYFLLLAYCRYKDKKDIEKIGVFPLEDNHPSDGYLYEVGVQTGFVKSAGTTADVFIILNGSLGETSPRTLKNPNRKCFHKGDTDAFLLSTPFSLGLLKSIEIWHNNAGNSPGWYLMQVQIKDIQTDKKYIFVCNRWLAVEEDDGEIKRKVDIATKDDLVQFDFLFAQTARKNLYDGHIWFSIFTRPPRSHFTRCQRLGCCLTLLLTSMLANAMFYKDPAPATATDDPNAPKPEPSDSIHLGPITISVEQIKIGFTSSLVVVPVNLIIATLFQKAKPKEDKKKADGEKYKAEGEEDEESAIGANPNEVSASKIDLYEKGNRHSIDVVEDDEPDEEMDADQLEVEKSKKRANFLKMICMPGNEDEDDGGDSSGKGKKKAKPKASLPHWVIYIAYILIFLASGTAAFFVILYGFQFGKEKSDNWMTSMMLSFWQSVIVIQPIKVLALSVLFAMIIKDPKAASGDDEGGSKASGKDEKGQGKKKKKKKIGENGEELEEEESEEEEDEEAEEEQNRMGVQFKLPDEKKLEEARQLRLKEKKMRAIIREIVIHLLFVMLCLFIGYSNMDPFAVGYGTSVRTFAGANLQKVTRVEEYWKWVDKTFIPYLYPGKWYNGISPYKAHFVADNEPSKVLAMARMRQLRVKKDTCTIFPVFENIISECNGPYSWGNEDTEQYSAGWKAPLNTSETRKLRRRKRKALWLGLENAWQHQSVLKLKNFPFLGNFGTYSGSSYSVSIGPDERISRLILKYMKDNFWIDRYTRAVFHEVNIYNANTNLMMIFTLVSEILNTGGWNYFDNVQAIRLYRWQGGIGGLIAIADLVFMIVTLVGLYKLVKACRKEGVKNYLRSAWNFLHAFVTVFSICTFSCVFARVGAVMWAMKQYKKDPEVFVSFSYLGQLDYFVQAFIGFVVMATNLEFLRLLRFNKKIGLLTATIRQSMKPLASFGIIFSFIFLSYVCLAHLLFVGQLENYKNFGSSVVSLTRMFLGQFDVPAYRAIAPILGPMMFFTYMVAIQMVLINMFIGIICETFEEVRIDIEKQSNDHEIVSFMTNRFKKIAGAAVGPAVDPIYREWKSEWELTMDSIEEKSDSIIYLLRNVEAEEVRQNRWFEPSAVSDKKKNMLTLLVGSDEFIYENELLDTLQLLDKRMKKMSVEKSQKMLYSMAKKKKKEKEEELIETKSRTDDQSMFSEEDTEEDDNEGASDENEG